MNHFLNTPIHILALNQASSTNDVALAALEDYPAVLAWTLHQHGGRGSRGRAWSNPPQCGLAFSLAFRGDVAPPPNEWCYPLFAGLVWYDTLSELGIAPGLSLKWPNDIFWDGRKLAGILCESRWLRKRVHTVIGIGTNLKPHAALDQLPAGYATLAECQPNLPAAKLVETALQCFEQGFTSYRDQAFLRQTWLDKAWVQPGQPVRVQAEKQRFDGFFQGLSDDGALAIRSQMGHTVYIQPTCMDFSLEPLDPTA